MSSAQAINQSSRYWNVSALLRRVFEPLLRLYVYLLVLLPSGSLFGINFKIICFLLLLPAAVHHLFQQKGLTLRHLSLLFALPAVFSVWLVIAQSYEFDFRLSISEYREVLVMFASAWLAAIYFIGSRRASVNFLRTVLHAEVAACVLKIALLSYCAYQGLSVAIFVDRLNSFFGVNLMGMDFESSLGRIQFIADGLIPLCFYILLCHRTRLNIRIASALIMFVLLFVSLAFSFSRYFWAFGALAICLGFIVGKKDRFHGFLAVTSGLILIVLFPLISTLIQLRFSGQIAGGSDQPRTVQTIELKRFFFDAPLFGHGFGSFTHAIIRSNELPYVYEVQLLALAGQEGFAGLLLTGLIGAYYFRFIWFRNSDGQSVGIIRKASLTLLLLFWIGAGFVNPSLLSSAAAISYATIKALANLPDERESIPVQPAQVKPLSISITQNAGFI